MSEAAQTNSFFAKLKQEARSSFCPPSSGHATGGTIWHGSHEVNGWLPTRKPGHKETCRLLACATFHGGTKYANFEQFLVAYYAPQSLQDKTKKRRSLLAHIKRAFRTQYQNGDWIQQFRQQKEHLGVKSMPAVSFKHRKALKARLDRDPHDEEAQRMLQDMDGSWPEQPAQSAGVVEDESDEEAQSMLQDMDDSWLDQPAQSAGVVEADGDHENVAPLLHQRICTADVDKNCEEFGQNGSYCMGLPSQTMEMPDPLSSAPNVKPANPSAHSHCLSSMGLLSQTVEMPDPLSSAANVKPANGVKRKRSDTVDFDCQINEGERPPKTQRQSMQNEPERLSAQCHQSSLEERDSADLLNARVEGPAFDGLHLAGGLPQLFRTAQNQPEQSPAGLGAVLPSSEDFSRAPRAYVNWAPSVSLPQLENNQSTARECSSISLESHDPDFVEAPSEGTESGLPPRETSSDFLARCRRMPREPSLREVKRDFFHWCERKFLGCSIRAYLAQNQ